MALPRAAKIGTSSAALSNGTKTLKSRISPATKSLPESCRLSIAPTTLRVSFDSSRVDPNSSIVARMVSTGFTSPGQSSASESTARTIAMWFRLTRTVMTWAAE